MSVPFRHLSRDHRHFFALRSIPKKLFISPVALTTACTAGSARTPHWNRPESSTNQVRSRQTALPASTGRVTDAVLTARATEMTMSATAIHFCGPSMVPWPVPCS